ncbi:MAG TPA: hypothetical protein VNO32_51795 [Candidatus Acidoferrum sp.]|nr:hypothetical protein [Candidatus Acidoferrum sp.]
MKIESITLREVQMRLKALFETIFGVSHHRRVILVEGIPENAGVFLMAYQRPETWTSR